MITADPDITRLLSRLKALKLVRQQRDKRDRRVVWTHISQTGLDLLAEMDPTVLRMPAEILGHLNQAQVSEFIHLLELARARCHGGSVPVSCDGSGNQEGNACSPDARAIEA
jgi:DNA-binding MarR family transcriptional regulator